MKKLNIMLDEGAIMPTRAHKADAGLDIYSPIRIVLHAGGNIVVDTGVHIQIPEGYVGILKSKSGLNVNHDITGTGVIDAGYTGSIKVKLYNNGSSRHVFEAGDKLIQFVIFPIETPEPILVDEFPETDRGSNGFGSSGR